MTIYRKRVITLWAVSAIDDRNYGWENTYGRFENTADRSVEGGTAILR